METANQIFQACMLILGASTPLIILITMIYDSVLESRAEKKEAKKEAAKTKKPYVNEKLEEAKRIELEYQEYKLKYGAKA